MNSISQIVKKSIQPILKAEGFSKKSLYWWKNRSTVVDVLTVQISKGSSSKDLQFTLNAGVFVPRFHELIWGEVVKEKVEDADCALRFRIGPDDGQDWWNVKATEDEDVVIEKLASRLSSLAFPFWDEYSSVEEIFHGLCELGEWKKQYWLTQFHVAIAAYMSGSKDMCRTILDELSLNTNRTMSNKAKNVLAMLSEQ
jgi:hypothetical protein